AQADQRDESNYTTEALERDCDRRCDGRRLTAELTYKWCGHYGRAKRAVNRRVSIAGHPSCTVTSALDQSRYPAFLTTTLYRPCRSFAPRRTSVSALPATESTRTPPRRRS